GNVKMSDCPEPELPERLDLRELDIEGGDQPAIRAGIVVDRFRLSEASLDVGEGSLAAIHGDQRTVVRGQAAASLPDRTRVLLLLGRESSPELRLSARRGGERAIHRCGALLEHQTAIEQVSEPHGAPSRQPATTVRSR